VRGHSTNVPHAVLRTADEDAGGGFAPCKEKSAQGGAVKSAWVVQYAWYKTSVQYHNSVKLNLNFELPACVLFYPRPTDRPPPARPVTAEYGRAVLHTRTPRYYDIYIRVRVYQDNFCTTAPVRSEILDSAASPSSYWVFGY
jgi:hypothetical protein